jgi:hypothetical protein
MNEIEELEKVIRREFPAAEVSVDGSVEGPKTAWLDIVYGDKWVIVEWWKSKGVGVSLAPAHPADPSEGLFSGPDAFFTDWAEARRHIFSLLAAASTERRPRRVALG